MAKNPKSILKTYFQTGKVPTQGQYEDLIDSQLNLAEIDTQIIQGKISGSTIHAAFHVTASGDISASGTVYSSTGSFNHINSPIDDNLFIESDKDINIRIDSDGDESGHLRIYEGGSANPFWQVKDDGKTIIGGSPLLTSTTAMLTVNGDISGSDTSTVKIGTASFGVITGSRHVGVNFDTPLTASKDINCLGTIFGTLGTTSEITGVGTLTSLNVAGNTFITASIMKINMSGTVPLSITGSISSSGGLTAGGEISGSFISSSHGISTLGDIRAKNLDIFNSASFGNIYMTQTAGTDDSVVVLNSSGKLVTDEINSDVWDTSKNFVDASNGVDNRIPTFTDADSLNGEANLTFNGSILATTGDITATSGITAAKTVLGTGGIYARLLDDTQVVTWNSGASFIINDQTRLTFKIQIRQMCAITFKATTTEEFMTIRHSAITPQSILLATCDAETQRGVGVEFFQVGNEVVNFRLKNLNGQTDISQGETGNFNIMILAR